MVRADEKRQFKELGFITIRDAIDPDVIEEARSIIWDAMPMEPGEYEPLDMDPEQVYQQMGEMPTMEPFDAINQALHEYAEELIGEGELVAPSPGEGAQIALRFPQGEAPHHPEATQPSDLHGHIEGYGHDYQMGGEIQYGSLIGGVYLNQVRPMGGGFTVWPGSHWTAAEYFETHSLESGRGGLPAIGEDGNWDYDRKRSDQFDPFEITGDAGTVFLAHYKLEHTGGVNLSPKVRMSMIRRFQRRDAEGDQRDAAANPFKYWPAMQDVELNPTMDPLKVTPEEDESAATVDVIERRR